MMAVSCIVNNDVCNYTIDGDLLLTGTAWPTVGSLPKPVCAGCGWWPGWPSAPVSDESAFEVA